MCAHIKKGTHPKNTTHKNHLMKERKKHTERLKQQDNVHAYTHTDNGHSLKLMAEAVRSPCCKAPTWLRCISMNYKQNCIELCETRTTSTSITAAESLNHTHWVIKNNASNKVKDKADWMQYPRPPPLIKKRWQQPKNKNLMSTACWGDINDVQIIIMTRRRMKEHCALSKHGNVCNRKHTHIWREKKK